MDTPLSAGEEAALTCRASRGDGPLTLTWTFDGLNVTDDDEGVRVLRAGSRTSIITVASVTGRHSGVYMCTASNAAGMATHSARLTVRG